MTSVIICDDSSMARKQMAKTLPPDWDIELTFANGGQQCLDLLRTGKGDIVFLDLNMPEIDGYDVLRAIREEGLQSLAIVISGDVQPEARVRVKKMGAIEFIKKPLDCGVLSSVLKDYGLYTGSEHPRPDAHPSYREPTDNAPVTWKDALQEISNIAMGQAGDLLARILDDFVTLPIPAVSQIDGADLSMTVNHFRPERNLEVVSQGFIGSGLAGEAIVMLSDDDVSQMADLLGLTQGLESSRRTEVLTEMTSVLVGAFLKGLSSQLDITFDLTHPRLLGCSDDVASNLAQTSLKGDQLITIEINYTIQDRGIECDLLLVFSTQATDPLLSRLNALIG